MIVVGFGLAWASYTAMFWGWSLIKGYDLTLGQIVSPKAYTGTWPPAAASAVTASSSSSATSSPTSTTTAPAGTNTATNNDGPVQPEGSGTE